jgi:hypothetical protein
MIFNNYLSIDKYEKDEWFENKIIEENNLKDISIYILNKNRRNINFYLVSSLQYYKKMISNLNNICLYDLNDSNQSNLKIEFMEISNFNYIKNSVLYKYMTYFKDKNDRDNWINKKGKENRYNEYDFQFNNIEYESIFLYFKLFWKYGYQIIIEYTNEIFIPIEKIREYYELNLFEKFIDHNINSVMFTMPDRINMIIYKKN